MHSHCASGRQCGSTTRLQVYVDRASTHQSFGATAGASIVDAVKLSASSALHGRRTHMWQCRLYRSRLQLAAARVVELQAFQPCRRRRRHGWTLARSDLRALNSEVVETVFECVARFVKTCFINQLATVHELENAQFEPRKMRILRSYSRIKCLAFM
jgi:hypothetical protein